MKLKLGLLSLIIDNINTPNKYSKAYMNLKNVFELEKQDGFEFSKEIIKEFAKIEKRYLNFLNDIPLQVIEKYYFLNYENINKFVYLEFEDKEVTDLRILDLYLELETYFNQIFTTACEIANLYNLEIKLNSQSKTENFI